MCPFPFGLLSYRKKIILQLTRPSTPNGIIGVHTLNFCYQLCTITWPKLTVSQVDIDARTTRNPCYAKFSSGLASSSQKGRLNQLSYILQLNRAKIVQPATLYRRYGDVNVYSETVDVSDRRQPLTDTVTF